MNTSLVTWILTKPSEYKPCYATKVSAFVFAKGATTLSKMKFTIMTFRIKALLLVTLRINDTKHKFQSA